MKDGQRLTLEELRDATAEAVSGSGKTQSEVASELDVTGSAISRATNEAVTNLAGLQRRIVSHLTTFEIDEKRTVSYIVRKKGRN